MKRKQSFKYSKFENKKSNIQVLTILSTDGVGAKKISVRELGISSKIP